VPIATLASRNGVKGGPTLVGSQMGAWRNLALPRLPLRTEPPPMVALKRLSSVMSHPTAYRLWQAPCAAAKFAPIMRHNDMTAVRRVLDVGCGPGTNAPWFEHVDYLGIDINPQYIATARRTYGRAFEVADVCQYEVDPTDRFDFILLNSLLHHIETEYVHQILDQLGQQVTPDGHVHILDLVLPESPCVARTLALGDRGDWPRPLDEWESIFSRHFEPVVCEPYEIRKVGVTLWNMVYFKGKVRR
jgi:SAM-dependent methyltransferase